MNLPEQSADEALRQHVLDAAVGTVVGIAGNQIGSLSHAGQIDPATHIFLHGLVGGAAGAALGGREGMAAGAFGAALAAAV